MGEAIPVFDGHNDLLLRLQRAPEARDGLWLKHGDQGHLDLPRMRAGGFAGGLFAIFVPSPEDPMAPDLFGLMDHPPYDVPLPVPVPRNDALPVALSAAAQMLWLERVSGADLAICRTAAQCRAAMAGGTIAGVMQMEGAEAIDEGLEALHVFHGLGLRSLGPVWSRSNTFGHGVPFRFPGGPDIGSGLTEAGRRLVRECNALKILIDLSHLNEKGFDDVAAISDAPLVASHSNAHALCPSPRNLTDRQLAMIAESCGLVGMNFATFFLRPDGRGGPECGWDPMLRQLDYLISRLGEDHVGFGSDFDGAPLPTVLGDVTGLPRLIAALRAHGYGEDLLHKLAHGNWLVQLERALGA